MRWGRVGLVVGLVCAAATARAQTAGESDFHLALQAGTNFPIDVGGGLGLEVPGRVQFSAEVGMVPGAYVDAANAALQAAQVYDSQTGATVHQALRSSLIWRGHVGWRPFARSGFFVQGGYGYGSVEAGLSAGEVGRVMKTTLPDDLDPTTATRMHTTVQLLDAQLGWQWMMADRFIIRAALGGLHAFSSSSHLDVVGTPQVQQLAQPLATQSAKNVDHNVRGYGNTLELTLGLGFRAF